MKKYLFVMAALTVAAISCEKEQDVINETPIEEDEFEIIGVIHNVEDESADVKTEYTFNNGTLAASNSAIFSWSVNDEIQIIKHDGTNLSHVSLYAKETSATSKFQTSSSVEKDPLGSAVADGTQTGFAIYPVSVTDPGIQRPDYLSYSKGATVSDVQVTLQEAYTLASLDNQMSNVAMIGLKEGETNVYNFYPAVGVLAFSLSDVPTTATQVRLTSLAADKPISGTFTLSSSDPTIAMSRVVGEGNLTRTVTLPTGRVEKQDMDIYVQLPVGELSSGLRIELLDGTSSPIFKKKHAAAITIESGVIQRVTLTAPGWKKLGTGKFIDTPLWGVMKFAEFSDREVGYVDVIIEQNTADHTQYRIANPYGAASDFLSDVGVTQDTHSDYLTFSIAAGGAVTFSDCKTGFVYNSNNMRIKQNYTTADKLITGTNTNPSIVQLAPRYYRGDTETVEFSRDGETNIIRIVFPSAVSSSTGSVTINTGNPYFSNGASFTNSAYNIALYVHPTSPYAYAATKRNYAYEWSIGDTSVSGPSKISTKSTDNKTTSGSKTSGNLGVNTTYFASSQKLYLYWYTYDSSGNILMQGCRKFYYLVPSEEQNFSMQFKAPTAVECDAASSSKTPTLTATTPFSAPSAYTLTFAPSDNLLKGNIMVTEFCGIKGKAYGYYNPGATFPIMIYNDEDVEFCSAGGTSYVLREGYQNAGTGDGQDPRGVSRFKLTGTHYGGVQNSIACWGADFGLRASGGSMPLKVSPFFALATGTKIDLSTKTVEPSSTATGDGSLAGLYDGRPSTYWHSAYAGHGTPAYDKDYGVYIDIDLGAEGKLTNFMLRFCLRAANAHNDHINHIKVYATNDKADWGEALADLDNIYSTYGPGYWTPFLSCTAAAASQYIRVAILQANGSAGTSDLTNSGCTHMAELQLYSLD